MPRNVELEIDALLAARKQQIPQWHDFVRRGEQRLSLGDHIELIHGLLGVQSELIVRLAREIGSLAER